MKCFFYLYLMVFAIIGKIEGMEKILVISFPRSVDMTNSYPQEESVGFFIYQMLLHGLAALSEWRLMTEVPTNRGNFLVYRLETTYTLSGPINRPVCLYRYFLYNDKNEMVMSTNAFDNIQAGMLDAVDVGIFATSKSLGEDLSKYAFVNLTLPVLGKTNYSIYLNKNKILETTNTSRLTLQYRIAAGKEATFSFRENPSILNLWLGKTLWKTNITLDKGQSTSLVLQPLSSIVVKPVESELFFVDDNSYQLSVFPLHSPHDPPLTNIFLSSWKNTLFSLPFGGSYLFIVTYHPKKTSSQKTNLIVDTKDIILTTREVTFQPIDRKQTRPFYFSLYAGIYLTSLGKTVGFPSFLQNHITLYYYPTMQQRWGVSLSKVTTLPTPGIALESENIIGAFIHFGSSSPKYHFMRTCVDVSLGIHMANIKLSNVSKDGAFQTVVEQHMNQVMTGPLFDIAGSVEFGVFSLGIGLWGTLRSSPLYERPEPIWGVLWFAKIII